MLCCWTGFDMFLVSFCPTGPAANAPKQESGTGEAPAAGEDEERKKQKRGEVLKTRTIFTYFLRCFLGHCVAWYTFKYDF